MSYIEKLIAQQAVSNTTEIIATVTTGKTINIKDINIANTGTTDCEFDLWLVPDSGSPTNENILIPTFTIPAHNIRHWQGLQTVPAGYTLQAKSEINDQITVTVSGYETTP